MSFIHSDSELTVPVKPHLGIAGPASPDFIRIGMNTVLPYSEKIASNLSGLVFRGPIPFLMKAFLHRVKMHSVALQAEDAPLGTRLPNGTFIGRCAKLWNGQLDLLPGPNIPTEERFANFHFSRRYVHPINGVLSWKPEKIVEPFGFFNTFQPNIWVILVMSMILISVVCAILGMIHLNDDNFKVTYSFVPKQFFILFINLMGQSFQQQLRLKTLWYYDLLCTFFIARFFLITFFTSEMTNMMLLRKTEFTVNKLEDVLKRPDILIAVANATGYELEFRNPKTPLFRLLQPRVLPNPGMALGGGPLIKDVMLRLERRKAVLYSPVKVLQGIAIRWMHDYPESGCRLKIVEDDSVPISFYVMTNKTFPAKLKRLIDNTIARLDESDLFTKHTDFYLKNFRDCTAESKSDFAITSLSFKELSGVFITWIIGLVIAFFVIVIERLCTRHSRVVS